MKKCSVLQIRAILVPAVSIEWGYRVQWFEKAEKNVYIGHLSHSQTYIITISAQRILHIRKREFNRIEIRRIWGKKLASHTSENQLISRICELQPL
jgi:hypothetical protein